MHYKKKVFFVFYHVVQVQSSFNLFYLLVGSLYEPVY